MLQAELEESNKLASIGRLAGGIAHHYNNLLTAILGYTDLLAEQIQDRPGAAQDLDEIRTGAERASRITGYLLASVGMKEMNFTPVDVNQFLTARDAQFAAVAAKATISFRLASETLQVRMDQTAMTSALVEILRNSNHAVNQGGAVTIQTRTVQSTTDVRAVIEVIDDGAGMTAETRARVFDPFFTTKGMASAEGLGMSMARGVVQQHAGEIELEDAPGGGTCVRITLPIER